MCALSEITSPCLSGAFFLFSFFFLIFFFFFQIFHWRTHIVVSRGCQHPLLVPVSIKHMRLLCHPLSYVPQVHRVLPPQCPLHSLTAWVLAGGILCCVPTWLLLQDLRLLHTLVCLWLASLMHCLSLPPSLLIYSRGCKVIAQLWGQAELHTQLCGCRWSQPTSTRTLQGKLLGWQRSLKRQTSQDRKPDGSNPYWGSQFWCRVF